MIDTGGRSLERILVAIIFTCFNRKKQTLECLNHLYNQQNPSQYKLDFFICDDASTDGTSKAIREQYPDVHLIESEGNLFWCKGMWRAMSKATETYHDYYLMVNDDVEFFDDIIDMLVQTHKSVNCSCGVVGSTISRVDGQVTYGGRKKVQYNLFGKGVGLRSNILITEFARQDDELVQCDLTNWNCFLIDRTVVEKIGIIDSKYEHGLGDFDYSFRMGKSNIPIYIAPKPVGYCERNSTLNTWADNQLPARERIKKLFGPKGYPYRSAYRFGIRTNGPMGILLVSNSYIKKIIRILMKK